MVTLDADLQNPPEEIGKLLAAMDAGHDYVGGVRRTREDSWWRRIRIEAMNRLRERITRIRMTDQGCMLRAYSRDIVDAIAAAARSARTSRRSRTRSRTIRPRSTSLHEERAAGESKYSLYKLIRLNFDLITGFSLVPLQLFSMVGMIVALARVVAVLHRHRRSASIVGGCVEGIKAFWDRDILAFFLIGCMLFGSGSSASTSAASTSRCATGRAT